MQHMIQLTNGETLIIEENNNGVSIGLHDGFSRDIEAWICTIGSNGVTVMPNSGTACEQIIEKLDSTKKRQFTHIVHDANLEDEARKVVVIPDVHGFCVEFEGSEETMVVDLSAGVFRVYCSPTDEMGEPLIGIGKDISDVVEENQGIPVNYEVQPLADDEHPKGRVTCGECGRSWDDDICTGITPAPSGRCPFEYFHEEPKSKKTRSVVNVTIKAYVEHDSNVDPCEVVNESDYDLSSSIEDGNLGTIYDTEMTETNYVGEINPETNCLKMS